MVWSSYAWRTAAVLVALLAYGVGPGILRAITTLGIFRTLKNTPVSADDLVIIENTIHCEDVHYHAQSNSLFAACATSDQARLSWFPPLANFDDPVAGHQSQGSIHFINPDTMKARRLTFEHFDGPFSSHGIDVISDPINPKAVYIFAVNHIPSPAFLEVSRRAKDDGNTTNFQGPKELATIEVFHHVLSSSSVKHLRSIQHPLLIRPNDIVATSPTELYVTNDHYYEAGFPRLVEDLFFSAKWTNVVGIHIKDMWPTNADPTAAIVGSVALDRIHNANGLAHGASPREILVTDCSGGVLHVSELAPEPEDDDDAGSRPIRVLENVEVDSTIDNPSYFADPFATDAFDASGYVLAGLARGIDLPAGVRNLDGREGVMVWCVKRVPGAAAGKPAWEKRLLFEDDGSRIRVASAAVLVAINPKNEGGKRKAWLVITGFLSSNAIAVKVDL